MKATTLLIFSIAYCSGLFANTEEGYFTPPDQIIEIGRFQKLIKRTHHNEFEKELISKAEKTPYDQNRATRLLIQRFEKYGKKRIEVDMHSGEIWATNSFDGIFTAIVITEKSIGYYSDTFDAIRNGDDPLKDEGFLRKAAKFKYESHVESKLRNYPDGSSKTFYIVNMRMVWSVSGQWLDLNRKVIFDSEGDLVFVIENEGGGLTVT